MNLPQSIRDLPIRRKVTLLLLVPCVAVLLLAGGALFGFQIRMFRQDFARDLTAVAEIVGANSAAAVTFNTPDNATEVLQSLKAKSYIVGAALVLPDGQVFAQYGQPLEAPAFATVAQLQFRERDALRVQPVILDGKVVATLYVVSDYRTVYANLRKLGAGMLVLLVVVGSGVGVLLSNWLQRLISEPVMSLTQAAQTVADHNDYSVRVREGSGVELRLLGRTFNQMLARIQEQDAALTLSQSKLEALIHSIDGIVWECRPDTFQFTFVSRQVERLLGYTPEQWLGEPDFWQRHLHPDDAAEAIQSCHDFAAAGQPYSYEYRMRAADGRAVWLRESGSILFEQGQPVAMRGILQDITNTRAAATEVDRLNRGLLEASRLAGMAEVATGVLHNVGNVLNSVSVSAALVNDRLKQSKIGNLRRAMTLLRERNGDLGRYLTEDPKGRVLPEYLGALSEHLATDQGEMLQEVTLLTQNIEHMKEIVAMQQGYARVSGAFEHLPPTELIEDALRINSAALDRHRVEVHKEYGERLPKVKVDRHKVLQILINLLRNAKYALDAGCPTDRLLTVRVQMADPGTVAIHVLDNGVGIAPENLARVFGLGFTTKKDGHGFGLHTAANAAKEMGGRLTARSEGVGKGAEFILELPVAGRNGTGEKTAAPAGAVAEAA